MPIRKPQANRVGLCAWPDDSAAVPRHAAFMPYDSPAALGSVPTAGLPDGVCTVCLEAEPPVARTWQLRADATDPATDAANGVIRPDDYSAAANPRAWYRA